jgi:hypothetical protein
MSLMLPTCRCIAFGCLNLNLCLNSFVCPLFKIVKPFLYLFLLCSFLACFYLSPASEVPRSRSPTLVQPLAVQLGPSPQLCLCPLFSVSRSLPHHSSPQPSFPIQPSAAHVRVRRPQPPTGGTRLSSPTSAVPDPDSRALPNPCRVRLPKLCPHTRVCPYLFISS